MNSMERGKGGGGAQTAPPPPSPQGGDREEMELEEEGVKAPPTPSVAPHAPNDAAEGAGLPPAFSARVDQGVSLLPDAEGLRAVKNDAGLQGTGAMDERSDNVREGIIATADGQGGDMGGSTHLNGTRQSTSFLDVHLPHLDSKGTEGPMSSGSQLPYTRTDTPGTEEGEREGEGENGQSIYNPNPIGCWEPK